MDADDLCFKMQKPMFLNELWGALPLRPFGGQLHYGDVDDGDGEKVRWW